MEDAHTLATHAAPHAQPVDMPPGVANASDGQLVFCHPPHGDCSWMSTGWLQPIQDVNVCPEVPMYAAPVTSVKLFNMKCKYYNTEGGCKNPWCQFLHDEEPSDTVYMNGDEALPSREVSVTTTYPVVPSPQKMYEEPAAPFDDAAAALQAAPLAEVGTSADSDFINPALDRPGAHDLPSHDMEPRSETTAASSAVLDPAAAEFVPLARSLPPQVVVDPWVPVHETQVHDPLQMPEPAEEEEVAVTDARIYFKNCPAFEAEQRIREVVEPFGTIVLIDVMDSKLHNRRVSGFIHMDSQEAAQAAVYELNNTVLGRRAQLFAKLQSCKTVMKVVPVVSHPTHKLFEKGPMPSLVEENEENEPSPSPVSIIATPDGSPSSHFGLDNIDACVDA